MVEENKEILNVEEEEREEKEPRVKRGRKVVCEFCQSRLSAEGDVLQLSDRAKELRKHEQENEKLSGTIETLKQEIADLKEKLGKIPEKTEVKKPRFSFAKAS